MGNRFKTSKRLVPAYAIFPLLSCITVNFIVYIGTDYLAEDWKHYDLTLPLDRAVPVIPAFAVVYLGCYIFWIVNYILIVRQGEEHCIRFITADMISRLVCGIFYLAMPTTNIRPVLDNTDFWNSVLLFVYKIDTPTRLFPSIHCLVSWFCFIGIRGRKEVPKAYRVFSCLFALLVCASTQFTKQHYIVDVIGGILLAEGTYWAAFHTKLYLRPKRLFDWLYQKCFRRKEKPAGKRVNCGE